MAWLPNLLTCSRIILTPFIVWAILTGQCDLALPVSMVAGLTDAADGYAARRLGSGTRLGAWLDPIADKLLLTSLYISFAIVDLVPDWVVWLVVGRDMLILAMAAAGLLLTAIRDFPPSMWGKLSTVIQIVTSVVLLAACAGFSSAKSLVPLGIFLVAALTSWSGIHYIWRGLTLFRAAREIV